MLFWLIDSVDIISLLVFMFSGKDASMKSPIIKLPDRMMCARCPFSISIAGHIHRVFKV